MGTLAFGSDQRLDLSEVHHIFEVFSFSFFPTSLIFPQLKDWSHWDEEQEEYHKQAAGWYFTQGFIQSQVVNNAPKAPDEDPSNVYDPNAEAEVDPNKVEAATTSSAPVKATSDGVIPPPAPKHSLEEEERLEKLEKKKTKKLQKKKS